MSGTAGIRRPFRSKSREWQLAAIVAASWVGFKKHLNPWENAKPKRSLLTSQRPMDSARRLLGRLNLVVPKAVMFNWVGWVLWASVAGYAAGKPTTGNPLVTKHPMTEQQCQDKLKNLNVTYENPAFSKICGGPYMAPLYDPQKQKPEEAKACIDQFEYPDKPCHYPQVWVSAKEAAELCQSQGKRLCDAHEWEGACAGQLLTPDYDFASFPGLDPEAKIKARRRAKNLIEDQNKVWAYGKTYQKGICATASFKNPQCDGGSRHLCGSNTYPAGSFPQCKSALEVYDQHGNAAEHMNLPVFANEMASAGTQLGYTEMKGSWFIWDTFYAHPDHCRWRAPFWHGTRVMSPRSHQNYHLGFRCCKSL